MRYNKNEHSRTHAAGAALKPFTPASLDQVRSHLQCIDYKVTPLFSLPELAAERGVGAIFVKDESQRSTLKSFKALGGAHAVVRVVLQEASKGLGRTVEPDEILTPEVQKVAASLTLSLIHI